VIHHAGLFSPVRAALKSRPSSSARDASSAEWVEAFCDMVRPALWALEKGQITSGVGPFLRARMRERRCHTGLEEFPVRYDKATRAQSIRGRMELRGGLYVPARARSRPIRWPQKS
jgi:hypothetical protein